MAKTMWVVFEVYTVERNKDGDFAVRRFGIYSTRVGAEEVTAMLRERERRHAFFEERYLNG